jgi:site-specific recombinase XerD
MRRVLIEIGKSTVSKSKTNAMITAMSAASNRIFNRPLSLDRSIMDLVKAIEKEFPKEVAQRPKNELKLKPILNTIQKYGPNDEMPLTNLQAKVLVLLLIFRSVRFTEAMTIERQSWKFDETRGVGSFTLQRKRETGKTSLEVFTIKQEQWDLVKALNSLVTRTTTKGEGKSTLFLAENGNPLSYQEVRQLVKQVLMEAGQPANRPYLLKSLGLSTLWKEGVRIQDIAAQAGHSFKTTTTLNHYISFDGGKTNMQLIADNGTTELDGNEA